MHCSLPVCFWYGAKVEWFERLLILIEGMESKILCSSASER